MHNKNQSIRHLTDTQPLLHENTTDLRSISGSFGDAFEHRKYDTGKFVDADTILQSSLDKYNDLIALISEEGDLISLSDSFRSLLGYKQHELPQKFLYDLTHEDDFAVVNQVLITLLKEPFIPRHFAFRAMRRDSSFVHLHCSIVNLLPVPEVHAIIIQGKEQLQKSTLTLREQDLQTIQEQSILLDNSTDAIIERTLDNRITFWNKGAEKIFGWKAQEVVGKNADTLLFQENTKEGTEATLHFEKNKEWHGELKHLTKNGTVIFTQNTWTLVEINGKPKCRLDIISDITEKKMLEAQLFRTQRLESIGTLASGVAHDLNNILSPIILSIDVIGRRLQDEDTKKILATMELSARRGSDLVKQVLSFGKGAEGEKMFIKIHHVVNEIENILKETFPKSISLTTKIPKSLQGIFGNPTQLNQVLMNLLVNARDAMPLGGTIEISAEDCYIDEQYARMNLEAKEGNYVLISVSDTGKGMSDEIKERIFEPFFTTKQPGEGTGLGLSTVLNIVKSHNGFINVFSEPENGTTFRVYLPTYKFSEEVSEKREHQSYPSGKGELLLVVDDEIAIREITKTTLRTFGYNVITAGDGAEAIALYVQQQSEIKLIITDMMMPYMDGTAAVRTFHRINPNIKILCISGLAIKGKIIQEDTTGLVQFLQKPFTSEKLLKTIRLMLDRQ